ncbi:hypothetical protein T459_00514 [Capsicum annuum]|uniref:Bifunctional inhibitor/plant lipid transfer protein/seed storage helical domain-containing protein n=1 Tax=Capsicum annuum TaxID=4072 RepID=A0A2G3AEG9_CAPAN|nr:hypothetical protein T459_00514 [Capsicum annuum]
MSAPIVLRYATCCDPLREAVTKDLDCLCKLYENPTLLPSLGINVTQAIGLPKYCDIPGDVSACKAAAPGSSSPSEKAPPGKMTNEIQMMDTTTSVRATNIATSSRRNAPPTMAPAEKPEKFLGIDFKRWQQKMFFYLTTLCLQRFTSEDAPEWNQDIKETVGALERKYKTEDVGIKKFLVARFLDFKMIDSKSVVSQVQELQVIIQYFLAEGLIMNDVFQVAAIVEKLPPLWKDFKNYLKHKCKEMTVEDLIVQLRIEENNKAAERRHEQSSGGSKRPRNEPIENEHNEENPRRSTCQRTSTLFGSDFVTFLLENEPQIFKEAMASSDSSFWKEAVNSEIDSILSNHTWELVDLPPGNKPLDSKWIFKMKMKTDGTIDKYKARLVVKVFK